MTRKNKRQILAVGAHPDDIELGAAMTLRNHIINGDEVSYIICSDGAKGGDISQRIKELENAAKLMEIKEIYRFGYTDASFPAIGEMVTKLEEIFYKINPKIVFIHNPLDRHQDHNLASDACEIAFRKAENILMYRSPRTSVEFTPHTFANFGKKELDFKIKVLSEYISQLKKGTIDLAYVEAEAKFWAKAASPYKDGVYSEAFLPNHMSYNL